MGYDAKTIERWRTELVPYLREPPPPDPSRSALLVVDAQVYFAPLCELVIGTIRRTIEECRGLDVPVVFTQHGHADPATDGGMLGKWWPDLILEGTPDHALIPDLGRLDEDPLVTKCRYDAFHGTALEELLDGLGVTDLVVAGVMTNLCVETTARSAFVRDFRARVLMDATATATEEMHRAALLNLAFGFAHVQTAADWLAGLGATGPSGSG
jgi:nicotinamidase-related amidase